MKVFWTETRPNGTPLASGVCLVTDLEDGTHPIYTYGADQDEVFTKLSLMNANAQLALARRANGHREPATTDAQPAQAAPRRTIGADEVMQATLDLENPAKAGNAIATLLESATGVDPRQESARVFAELAQRWQRANENNFYPHPANQQLMADRIFALTNGKMGATTMQMLDQVFNDLYAKGLLVERPAPVRTDLNDQTLTQPRPGETQAPQVTERPRGTRFATAASSLRFGSSQVPQRTPKYTEEQIRTMPLEKSRELTRSNDRDYAEACEYYYSQSAQAAR